MKTFLVHTKNDSIPIKASGFHIIERSGFCVAVFFNLYRNTVGLSEEECAAFKDFTWIETEGE